MKTFKPVIEQRLIESITPYHGNSKQHPPEQIDKLASMISEYGHDVPIVVDGDWVIIKGHGRLLACKKLGMTHVPVIVRDDLTPAQAKAARIADNKISESDWDMDMLKIELEELGEMDFDLDLTGLGDFDFGLDDEQETEQPDWAQGDDEEQENTKEPKDNSIKAPFYIEVKKSVIIEFKKIKKELNLSDSETFERIVNKFHA